MKKQTLMKFTLKAAMFAGMVIGAFSVISMFAPEFAESVLAMIGLTSQEGFILGATSVITGADTYSGANTAKPRTTTQPGHLKDDISRIVTKIRPDAAPLDTIMRKINNSEKAENIEVFFEEVEFRGTTTTVTPAISAPVDTEAPTNAEIYRQIAVANPAIFTEGETIYVKSILVSGKPLVLRVDKKNGDGTLIVNALNLGYVPAIANNTPIYRMAPAAGEMKAQVMPVTHYPDMRSNYCQRFMAQVEQSLVRKNVPSNSGFDWTDQNQMKIWDMRSSMERSNIWGHKGKSWSAQEQDWVYTQEGIFWQLEAQLEYTTASGINNDRWINWTRDLFSDNAGSQDRLLVGGSGLIADILKIEMVQKQLDAKSVEVVPGLKIKVVETSFGNILILHHKGFDLMGHENDGLILDMTNIKKRPFQNMKITNLELQKSGQRNVRARLIDEIYCIETRYHGTHARVIKTS
jgi:hypothetical protein